MRHPRALRAHRNLHVQQLHEKLRTAARGQKTLPRQPDGLEDCRHILVGRTALALGRYDRYSPATGDYRGTFSGAHSSATSRFLSQFLERSTGMVQPPGTYNSDCRIIDDASNILIMLGLQFRIQTSQTNLY